MISFTYKRYKHHAATHARSLLVVFAVVAVIGIGIAFTPVLTPAVSMSPFADNDVTPQTTHSGGVSQSVSTTVINDSEAFSAGQTLTDKSRYPRRNTEPPIVTGQADAQNAVVTNLRIVVTYTAAPAGEQANAFYSETETLAVTHPESSTGTIETPIQITDIIEQKQALKTEFGDQTIVTAEIRTSMTYTYQSSAGETLTKTVRTGGTMTTTDNMYSLPSDSNRDTQTTGGDSSSDGKLPRSLNVVSFFIGSLAFLWIFPTILFMYRVDVDELAVEIQRERFEEWVTEVKSYTPEGDVITVEVTNLNDLVNLAIDTQNRVLYHKQVNEYFVTKGNTMFVYHPEDNDGSSTAYFGFDPDDLDMDSVPDMPGSD